MPIRILSGNILVLRELCFFGFGSEYELLRLRTASFLIRRAKGGCLFGVCELQTVEP